MANTDLAPDGFKGGSSYLYEYGATPNTRTAVSQKVRVLTPHYGSTSAMHQMGVLSSLGPSENRGVDPVRGIGFGDKIAELVPSVTEPISMSFERALLYLCNLWQATGYAAGVDGPVRSLAHHRWPFDTEQQLVFSSLADADLGAANVGYNGGGGGSSGSYDGGLKVVSFPEVTDDKGGYHGNGARGHTAIITMYEACWFNSWGVNFTKDAGVIMETGGFIVSDVHDFASTYGEFLASGNDPTIGQLGSVRFGSGEAVNSSGNVWTPGG
jgi:hypothetical protein